MKCPIWSRLSVIAAVLSTVASPGLATELERFASKLPDGAELSFIQPSAWDSRSTSTGPSLTVELSPRDEGDFLLIITVFPVQPDSSVASPDGLRTAALEAGNQKLAGALQDAIELMEVRGDQVVGYLYHLTDRNPERGAGDYREATQGMLLLGHHVASVTILTHSDDRDTVNRATALLRSMSIKPD